MHTGKKIWKCCWALSLFLLVQYTVSAQGCPKNLGFEMGRFTNWEILAGSIDSFRGILLDYTKDPLLDVHTLHKKSNTDEKKDVYGDFPVVCPYGAGYSVQLGNATGGRGAESLHYTFTIPQNRNDFSLIYYYAVVMQNSGHLPNEQPRFTAKVFNVTTGKYITCSSFDYVASLNLPGFQVSPRQLDVLYKDWTPVTINLSRYAGATIRLEFTTNDCTQGAHFGYAYVDIEEDCLSPIPGTIICPGITESKLIAPKGFSSYKWFNEDFSKMLGTENVLQLPVVPAENTVFTVELTPFKNQGCIDTVISRIRYSKDNITLNVTQATIEDCIDKGVDITNSLITTGSSPGLIYSYYTDAGLTKGHYSPDSLVETGTYYIKATNADGCYASRPVNVKVNPLPIFTKANDPKPIFKPSTYDLTKTVSSAAALSYWMDAAATLPVVNPAVLNTNGTYYIKITSLAGCAAITGVTISFIDPTFVFPNVFSPNEDGVNDTWDIPVLQNYPDCIVEIYNRSGQSLFRSVGYPRAWDGKYNGKYVVQGTYYYIIRLTQTSAPVGGSVTVIR